MKRRRRKRRTSLVAGKGSLVRRHLTGSERNEGVSNIDNWRKKSDPFVAMQNT